MDIKITEVATQELERLDPTARKHFIEVLRADLPKSLADDRQIELIQLGERVRLHHFEDLRLLALYDVRDVDGDQRDEIVVLTIFRSDELPDPRKAGWTEVSDRVR